MNPTELASYVKAVPADMDFVEACWAQAAELVDHRIGKAQVPASIRDRAVLEVGADLWHRRQTRSGVATFDGGDYTPMRVTRDPMKAAADLLKPYLGPVIA
ncbi:hypothetical protein HMPREF9306_01447 [Propionimicrobium lymphophilum ACS-093-V-SCH5]|uniref:Uncharacterized protein n=1 Tax=Propionimicrobium lymphophilum ACS-093-V-SCH5 TaxID=883161 RepID=S2VYF7_9ACTN|nr:hypothetical protein [Propionimicrobium lymphophilum]EPD31891.1 hypothetical protein HMPREF9306_01447 [Propionimicrobium lymphophilum ACS-093-V-SCH5]